MTAVTEPIRTTPTPGPTTASTTSTPYGLSPADLDLLGAELDAIRQDVLDSRGERDAAYIRRLVRTQRVVELASRAVLLRSRRPSAWVVGTAGLALAKILDNMEIGHNVLHGQWDWMRDPKIHSSTWEWDHVTPAAQWKRAHNETHHKYTNILGKDNDLGYGIMRVDESQEWQPRHLAQPALNFLTACIFEWGIALFDLDLGDSVSAKSDLTPEKKADLKVAGAKAARQLTKDFVIYPALSGRSWRSTLAANATANLVRNLWSHSVIMCGHFPEGVATFEQNTIDPDETRGSWYLRQMLGSANISGPRLLHLMTGNLSHQIEHHIYPDLPSNRYIEVAPRVREVFAKFELPYNARSMVKQVGSAWHRVLRLSLPNGWLAETHRRNLVPQLRGLAARAIAPATAQPATA